jgi:hypothetical protein
VTVCILTGTGVKWLLSNDWAGWLCRCACMSVVIAHLGSWDRKTQSFQSKQWTDIFFLFLMWLGASLERLPEMVKFVVDSCLSWSLDLWIFGSIIHVAYDGTIYTVSHRPTPTQIASSGTSSNMNVL